MIFHLQKLKTQTQYNSEKNMGKLKAMLILIYTIRKEKTIFKRRSY